MSKASIPPARKKKIKKLLSMMNKQNDRFFLIAPPLVEMMDISITDAELDFLLKMGFDHYDDETAQSASAMPDAEFEAFFDRIKRKGLVHIESGARGNETYRLNAIAVGWYEAQTHYLMGKPEEKLFSEKFLEFVKFFQKFNFTPVRDMENLVLRSVIKPSQSTGIMDPATKGKSKKKVIPIQTEVSAPDSQVYPTHYINSLIEEFGGRDAICVFPCICRHANKLVDSPCTYDMPEDSCIAFGDMANAWASYGYGRNISAQEAMEILKTVREKGAVHHVIHEKDNPDLPVLAICNCCWDCCGILKPYNMGAMPLKYKSYYVARIKADADCKGCGTCEKYCPTTAIRVTDKRSVLDPDRCIGCGQCAYQCVKNNIELVPAERTVYLPMLKRAEARISA